MDNLTREWRSAHVHGWSWALLPALRVAETQVGSGGVEYAFEYDYDGAHNRTLKVVDGTPTYYAYNEANQLLTEATDGATTYYRYDGRGNTVAKEEAAGTTYFTYSTENLMTRIDFAAGGNSYYDYDADSKRVSQRTAEGFRQFVYQGPDMLRLQMERDESEETVAHYTMGSGLEAMHRDGASSFYHYNHLGTALALTGADETVTDTYRHDAWGVLLASTGSTINPHTYVGRERYYRMPEAAMYHLGFRDYAQGVGRFTTVDPARWGRNWGVKAANRPTVFIDPLDLLGITPDCCDRLDALDRQTRKTFVMPNPWNCQWLNELLYRYLRSCGGFNPPQPLMGGDSWSCVGRYVIAQCVSPQLRWLSCFGWHQAVVRTSRYRRERPCKRLSPLSKKVNSSVPRR